MDESTEARLTLKRDFASFLDSDGGHGEYAARVAALLGAPGGVPARGARLDVDLQVRASQVSRREGACCPPSRPVCLRCEGFGPRARVRLPPRWEPRDLDGSAWAMAGWAGPQGGPSLQAHAACHVLLFLKGASRARACAQKCPEERKKNEPREPRRPSPHRCMLNQ